VELIFLGRGSGFNPAEGSTAAFFIENKKLFLIDAGESVFRTLMEHNILDGICEINIFITHTHSDHSGSLGSLVLYCSMVKRLRPVIIAGDDAAHLSGIKNILRIFGITDGMYETAETSFFDGRLSAFSKARYVPTVHCEELHSYGIEFDTPAGAVFYTGDIRSGDPVRELVQSGRPIDKIYVDSYSNPVPSIHHLSLEELSVIIPEELRPRVYCMHINNKKCIERAGELGFNVVSCLGR
jgi:phosphoribosyl 1,2-cyclic phosphodiesterase